MEFDYSGIRNMLLEKGASFVGFSNIEDLPENRGYKGCITIGIKLLDSIVEQIYDEKAPTYEYFHHYRTVNYALDQLALFTATYLERMGFHPLMIPASQSSVSDPFRGAFPHKSGAVKANLGFIGKNALFIHRDFGSKVRLATILLKEPLNCDLPPVTLRCGTCTRCKDACPANAITGAEYVSGEDRDTIFNAEACSRHMKDAYKHIGRGAVCGICMAVCPFNRIKQ